MPANIEDDIEVLDHFSKFYLRKELYKDLGDKFSGEPESFWPWQKRISRRLLEAGIISLDSLTILETNTSGRVKKIISTHIAAGTADPKTALFTVWKELKSRFGSNRVVSAALINQ